MARDSLARPLHMSLRQPHKSAPSLVLPRELQTLFAIGQVEWRFLRAWLECDVIPGESPVRQTPAGLRDVNGTVDEYGRTLLFYAVNAGALVQNSRVQTSDIHLVRALIAYGADPNISDNSGMTPLHYAARGGVPLSTAAHDCDVNKSTEASAKMVDLLVAHGANVNARGESFRRAITVTTPLSEAIYYNA